MKKLESAPRLMGCQPSCGCSFRCNLDAKLGDRWQIKYCAMHDAAKELVEAIEISTIAISRSWARCDEQTGEECKGIACDFGEHRALSILNAALDKARGLS